jgi:hypothetical protein
MIGAGLIHILGWVRFREGELRVQSGISTPSFHNSPLGSSIRSWFDIEIEQPIDEEIAPEHLDSDN